MAKKQLLIASNNPHKVTEIRAIAGDISIQLLSATDLGLQLDVIEDGNSYYANALKKARAFFEASGLPTLADDSGLEVQLLGGMPGIHSHRFSPMENATDRDRRIYLLEQLKHHPQPWLAEFHCEMVLINADGSVFNTHGVCPGEIIPVERGNNGFGYDPIFAIPQQSGLTMAELPDADKNHISHRANALMAMLPILRQIYALPN